MTEKIKQSLEESPLKSKFDSMMAEDSAFTRCCASEVVSPGVLSNLDHICNTCLEASNKKSVNPLALMNGFYCGKVPVELSCLSATELSMVSRINPITQIDLINGGPSGTVNSVSYTNDVISIAKQLPNLNGKAILRDRKSQSHYFRPKEVRDALLWLRNNNSLYADIELVFPPNWTEHVIIDATTMEFAEDVATAFDVDVGAGSAANISAVAPDNIYIADFDSTASSLHVLQQVVEASSEAQGSSRSRLQVVRPPGDKVQPHEILHFDALAFPALYPYGQGSDHILNQNYVKHRLMCGGNYRRFAESCTWIFTHYGYEIRKKNGAVSALSDKMSNANDRISKDDAENLRTFLSNSASTDASKMARIRQLLTYVAPFSSSIPGSQIYMEQEKSKMKSFVNSPINCAKGHWRWFFTSAQTDLHNPLIFDNLVAPMVGYCHGSQRQDMSDGLPKDKRAAMIRQNPVMPVRLWTLQQDAFFQHVINGSARPLGEVVDFIEKLEFQQRGTIHSHYLCCVRDHEHNDRYFTNINAVSQAKMIDVVDNALSAKLLRTDLIDSFSWDWHPIHSFDDANQPERKRLNLDDDFTCDESGVPRSAIVGVKMQELLLSSYMHSCRQQCFKYCRNKPRNLWTCRYEYPFRRSIPGIESLCHESDVAQVIIDKDKKSRSRLRVLPARNSAHLAPYPKSPLMVLAAGGNTNLQFLSNKYGAVDYTTNYIGKVDLPETKVVINTIIKLLGMGDEYHRNVLKAVLNGLSNGRRVSSTEAALYFLKHKIVDYSRIIKNVNPKPIQTINRNVDFNTNSDTDTFDSLQDSSHHTARKDYAIFLKKQIQMHGRCVVSFYSFMTSFRCSAITTTKKHVAVPFFEVDVFTGAVINGISFTSGNRSFISHKDPAVIHYRPYLKVDESDECVCLSLLLMYIPWPEGDETMLVTEGSTAVDTWRSEKEQDNVPCFAIDHIERELHRQGLDIGLPDVSGDQFRSDSSVPIHRVYDSDDDADEGDVDRAREEVPSFAITNTSGVHFGVQDQRMQDAKGYISTLKENLAHEFQCKYVITADELLRKTADPACFIRMANQEELEHQLTIEESSLVHEQRAIYDDITCHMLDPSRGQLISFVTGEGGTGKSKIISTIKKWADVVYGKQEGSLGSCALCAPTGPAAFNIGGETWQSAFGHSVEGGSIKTTEDIKNAKTLRQKFKGLKILILDEISMIGSSALWEMHIRLQVACDDEINKTKPFGGFHVLIFGVTKL